MFFIKFADGWIRTRGFWCQKRSLRRLSNNHWTLESPSIVSLYHILLDHTFGSYLPTRPPFEMRSLMSHFIQLVILANVWNHTQLVHFSLSQKQCISKYKAGTIYLSHFHIHLNILPSVYYFSFSLFLPHILNLFCICLFLLPISPCLFHPLV